MAGRSLKESEAAATPDSSPRVYPSPILADSGQTTQQKVHNALQDDVSPMEIETSSAKHQGARAALWPRGRRGGQRLLPRKVQRGPLRSASLTGLLYRKEGSLWMLPWFT